jgi:hypothetical protein
LVVIYEAVKRAGLGAELCAAMIEKAFGYLDAPLLRIGARDVPMPYNDILERATIPGKEEIIQGDGRCWHRMQPSPICCRLIAVNLLLRDLLRGFGDVIGACKSPPESRHFVSQ